MLELIVLGQIPGTHFQFSYAGIMLLAFALMIAIDLRHFIPRIHIKTATRALSRAT